MIRFARKKDAEALLKLSLATHPQKDKQFLEYYFSQFFDDGKALVYEEDHQLVSQIHKQEHILHYHGKLLKVSYLLGVSTHYEFSKHGMMKKLMEKMLEDCAHNHLLTFIEAENPKLYEPFGFETISFRKHYLLYAKELVKYKKEGVSEEVKIEELIDVYQRFASFFDCYYHRDVRYYYHLLEMVKQQEAHLCVYRNAQGIIEGYALYQEVEEGVEVKEIIYMDSKSMGAMLRYAIGYNPLICVEVSSAEKLEKIFPLTIPKVSSKVMARINDVNLYNKLFNSDVKSAKDIIAHLHKPVLINERY